MRGVQTPSFLRLGARMRGPAGLPAGTLSRVSISDVTIHGADPRYPSTIAASLDNVRAGFEKTDTRPAFVLDDVSDADFRHVRADKAASAPTFDLAKEAANAATQLP